MNHTANKISGRIIDKKPNLSTIDLQNVNITLRILYRPSIEHLPWIHQKYGPDYDERVLPSIGHEVLKSVVVSAGDMEETKLRC